MNSREIYTTAKQVADEHGWERNGPEETYLVALLSAREDARHSLLVAVAALRSDLDRLDQILQHPSPLLNSLGELQSRPAVVEAKAGEFAACAKALTDYLAAFPVKEG
jgi:hypothetical protein